MPTIALLNYTPCEWDRLVISLLFTGKNLYEVRTYFRDGWGPARVKDGAMVEIDTRSCELHRFLEYRPGRLYWIYRRKTDLPPPRSFHREGWWREATRAECMRET